MREAGLVTLLVTGRVLDDLRVAVVDFAAFEAVVAESGAVVWHPESDRTIVLGASPSDGFLGRLRAASAPFHAGAVVVATWDTHVPEPIRPVRETGVDLQLLFDRAAAAVGYQQGRRDAAGTGRTRPVAAQPRRVRRRGECPAARCPGQSSPWRLEVRFRPSPPPPMIACASREPRAWWLGSPSFSNETARCPHRGGSPSTSQRDDGTPAVLTAEYRQNVLVSGDPNSGKSWFAGARRRAPRGDRVSGVPADDDVESVTNADHDRRRCKSKRMVRSRSREPTVKAPAAGQGRMSSVKPTSGVTKWSSEV